MRRCPKGDQTPTHGPHPRYGLPWSKEDDDFLLNSRLSLRKRARRLGRSYKGTRTRYYILLEQEAQKVLGHSKRNKR